jgi:hypothetical protein
LKGRFTKQTIYNNVKIFRGKTWLVVKVLSLLEVIKVDDDFVSELEG